MGTGKVLVDVWSGEGFSVLAEGVQTVLGKGGSVRGAARAEVVGTDVSGGTSLGKEHCRVAGLSRGMVVDAEMRLRRRRL
jgi:hypothetical protein